MEDPYAKVLHEMEGAEIVLPSFITYDEDVVGPVGHTFHHRSSAKISLLCRLGILEKKEMLKERFQVTFPTSAYTQMRVKGEYPVSYMYEIVEELPFWVSIV
jgi:hypothetical protein